MTGPAIRKHLAMITVGACLLLASAGVASARPQRIVSTNVCADQLVMLLADPADIVSVSSLASDPEVSNLASEGRRHKVNHARAEEVIRLAPDLVVGDVQTGRHANSLARTIGVPVHLVGWPTSLQDVQRIITDLGDVLGQPARASRLVAGMRQRIGVRPPPTVTALLYEPNGLTTGAGTLADDVLAHAGLKNMAGDFTAGAYGAVPLELVIANPPQLLIMDQSYTASSSRAQALLRHPAFAALKGRTLVHPMKSRLLLCPGPWVAEAVLDLARQRKALSTSLANP